MEERINASMDANHEKMMAMFHTYEKRMMASLGLTEANSEDTV
jgi:hypothetical protein